RAHRTRVHYELSVLVGWQKIYPRIRQCARIILRRALFQRIPLPYSILAQTPQGLFPEAAGCRFEIPAVKENRARRQRIEHVFAAIALRIEKAPAIVVAEP